MTTIIPVSKKMFEYYEAACFELSVLALGNLVTNHRVARGVFDLFQVKFSLTPIRSLQGFIDLVAQLIFGQSGQLKPTAH